MSRFEAMWTRYRALPRAARWALLAAAIAVVGLIWNDYVLALADRWNRRADEMLAQLDEVTRSAQRRGALRSIEGVTRALGAVERPRRQDDAAPALNEAVNEVLKRHAVSRDSYDYRGPAQLPRGTLSEVVPPGSQAERILADLRFDADAGEVMEIIAELEDSPRIEAIRNVRLTKQGSGRVTTDLTVEAWIIAPRRGSARIGGL